MSRLCLLGVHCISPASNILPCIPCSAAITLDGRQIGVMGELHPRLLQQYGLPGAPIMAELDPAAVLNRPLLQAATQSKFQPVRRDIAVVVDEVYTSANAAGLARA